MNKAMGVIILTLAAVFAFFWTVGLSTGFTTR